MVGGTTATSAASERLGTPLTLARQAELASLGNDVMDIVTKAASRRLTQVLEFIHEEYIAPRDRRIAELELQLECLKSSSPAQKEAITK